MKPRIATLDGIFVLNHDGFYEPEAEPEQKLPRRWMGILWYGGAAICAALLCMAGYCLLQAWSALH
jgi:hypothetical protein